MSLRVVDFAEPRDRVPRLGVVFMAAGLMSLLAVAWCQERWAADRERALQEVERRAEALRVQRQAKPVVTTATVDEKRMQRVVAERSRPWMAALRAVESATRDPVFLLAMNADVSNHNLRLDAEAPSFEHALAYVQVLPDGVGIASAHLLSHESVTDATSGRQVVRFSVSARWRSP
ncbi:hypothetical protein LRS03_00465 [Rhizobacter sp. J219]|uniref:hypothetical protein n=1 Tax=Rhizobacter sp. J219 TaxID=2898430 RepID=UPI0021515C7A|nr:hypothetical protein [Rhizobacter sp. J219]MCR5881416.1 hypothetical protein [Rhizobacter sp. J219]